MRALRAYLLLGFLLAASSAGASAEDAIRAAAAEARAADEAGDLATLQRLALREDPDPWLIVDLLRASEASEVARRFAEGSPAITREALATYARGTGTYAEARSRALDRAQAALDAGDPRGAIKTLSGVEQAADVLQVRLLSARGKALSLLARYEESATAHVQAAEVAGGLGWTPRACEELRWAGNGLLFARRYEAALEVFQRRLTLEEALGNPMAIGRAHFGVALPLTYLGRMEEATVHRERAFALAREHGDPEYVGKALVNRALGMEASGDLPAALGTLEEGLASLSAPPSGSRPARIRHDPRALAADRARMLITGAGWAARLGEAERALRYAEEGRAAAEEARDPPLLARAEAQASTMRGAWSMIQGDAPAAEAHYAEALEMARRGGESAVVGEALLRWGTALSSQGRLLEALAAFDEARGALTGPRDAGALARVLLETANVETALGRHAAAQERLHEAVALARRLRDLSLEADALGMLGEHLMARGRHAQAIEQLEAALEAQARTGQAGNSATFHLDLGQVRLLLGETEAAERDLGRAAEGFRAAGDGQRLALVQRVRAKALLHEDRAEEALPLLEETLAQERRQGRLGGEAATLMVLADAHLQLGRFEQALEHDRLARTALERQGDEAGVIRAAVRVARGERLLGRGASSLTVLEEARQRAEKLGTAELLARTAQALAELHLDAGHNPEAATWARTALEAGRSIGLDLSEGEGAEVRSGIAAIAEVGLRAAVAQGDVAAVHEFIEAGRAGILTAGLRAREALLAVQVEPALLEAQRGARAAEAEALRAYERGQEAARQGRATLTRTRELLQTVLERREAVQQADLRVQRRLRERGGVSAADPIRLSDFQRRLRSEEAYVAYAVAQGRVLALLVRPTSAAVKVLGAEADLLAATTAVDFGDEGVDPSEGLALLRKRLVEPLGFGDDVRRLLLSPEGFCSNLPYGVLIPDREVVLLPSATLGVALAATPDVDVQGILALGDPSYGAAAEEQGEGRVRAAYGYGRVLPRLDSTVEEVESVADPARGGVRLLGKGATESALYAALRARARWRAVHLACHGLVHPERPMLTSLALLGDRENDGYLTVLDVLGLRLDADLVCLSACDTGLGRVVRGEGVMGLTRAFFHAGARRVIVSQWKVPDRASSALMRKFYELWNPREGPGLGAAAALREAQAFVRAQPAWRHPRYWGAWTVWGIP